MLRRGLFGRLRRWTLGLIAAACAGWASSITAAPVTITYSSWGSNEEIQRFRDLAAVFNERHTDIQVEILHITGDYNAALLTQLAAGVGPDSFHLFDSQPPQMARNGMLENLLPYLEKDPTLRLEDFYPPLLTLARYEGGLYGLPPDENPIVLYVNEEMFARSGLTSPIALDRSGDWTWQAFREAADKLAGPASGGGRTETYGFFLPNWWAPVLPFVWAGGGALFSEDASRSLLTDPATLAGLEFLAAMIHEDRSSSHVMPADPNGLFREGRLAMIPQGRWMVPTYRTLLSGIDWDVVGMPEGPAGRFTAIAGAFSGMNAHSPHKAEAWQWLRFFLGREGQTFRLGRNGNAVPSIRGLEETVVGGNQIPANARAFLDGLAYGRALPLAFGLYPDLNGEVFGALNGIWDGSRSPQAVAETLHERMQAILAENAAR